MPYRAPRGAHSLSAPGVSLYLALALPLTLALALTLAPTLALTLSLTPSGSISLTEKGEADEVPRHPDFRIFAAMNVTLTPTLTLTPT